MTGPQSKKTITQDEQDKIHALKQAHNFATSMRKAETALHREIRHAQLAGASLREIATATSIPHITIKQVLDQGEPHAQAAS